MSPMCVCVFMHVFVYACVSVHVVCEEYIIIFICLYVIFKVLGMYVFVKYTILCLYAILRFLCIHFC